jgi:thiamine pyrophosphate-dependent acetolactate synthase large subunit-like protein
MKLQAALARALVEHGCDTVFGLVGDANLFVVDSYVREFGGHFVPATHEANATLMAYGYAATSGRVGVVTVTHGPGLTNTLTALVEAAKSRTRLLLICGDTDTEDRYGPQVVFQRDLILPTGAGVEQVRTADTALEDLAMALRRASLERRPIALNVPVEFLRREVAYASHPLGIVDARPPALDEEQLGAAVGIIANARRPVILAGRGAGGARKSLTQLAERIGSPVATSLGGKDLFRDDPFDLGVFGTLSSPAALEAIYGADCIVAFGAQLNRYTTALGSLVEGKAVVQVDRDAARIGHLTRVDAAVVGDAAEVAEAIVSMFDAAGLPGGSFRSAVLAESLAAERRAPAPAEGAGPLDVREALRIIDTAVAPERTFVTDAGRYLTSAFTQIHVEHPEAFVFTVNFGAIGAGVGSAIGAAFGRPGHPVLLVCGDGGLMLGGLAELSTASRLGLDLVVVVCNDGAYGAEYVQLANVGLPTDISQFAWPPLPPLARALGLEAVTVRTNADWPAALELIAKRSGPVLIDLVLDPNVMPDVAH